MLEMRQIVTSCDREARRGKAQDPLGRRVHRGHDALGVDRVQAFSHVDQNFAVARPARAQFVLGVPALDGDSREMCRDLYQSLVRGLRIAKRGVVDPERAQQYAARPTKRGGVAGSKPMDDAEIAPLL
jgi:hypothetical protein